MGEETEKPAKCAVDHAVEITGVGVRRGGQAILEDVSATVSCEEVLGLVGPNGAGKSTLLRVLLGLEEHQGRVRFCAAPEHGAGLPSIGYVPQRLEVDRGLPLTVMDFLALADQRLPLWMGIGASLRARIRAGLERVDALRLADRPLGKLSGGELRRVLLAGALQHDPDILLLDEPMAGMDLEGEKVFAKVLAEIQRKDRFTLVLVSHDLKMVREVAHRAILLNRRVVAVGRPEEVLTAERLGEAFGLRS
ncbi:MAG: metal ABC transporter ATP-binding protein, partial [Planctomycetes bacterium]|jgi:zinc transport system ATP-binding protein|nr:metal ABC transporter ATP-binding protein [Planctomycetota bacterium]